MRMTSIQDSLGRFLENSGSEPMNDVAGQLLELLEADEVEPVGTGEPVSAEENRRASGESFGSSAKAERLRS